MTFRRLFVGIAGLITASVMVPASATPPRTIPPTADLIDATAHDVATDPASVEQLAIRQIAMLGRDRTARSDGRLAAAWWVLARAQLGQGDPAAPASLAQSIRLTPRGAAGNRLRGYAALLQGARSRSDGNFGQTLQNYRTAQRAFIGARDERGQALALQALGVLYNDVGNGPDALRNFDLAAAAYNGDDMFNLTLSNNRGVAFQHASLHAQAQYQFRIAVRTADRLGLTAYAHQIRLNIAKSELELHQYSAVRETLAGLGPVQNLDDPAMQRMAWRLYAQMALNVGNVDEARRLIDIVLTGVDADISDPSYRKDHFAAYQIYLAQGLPRMALEQLEAVRRIDAADAEITASNRAALLSAQFQFDAQNQRIVALQAEQLRRDVAAQKRLNMLISIAGVAVVMLLVGLLAMTIRSRNRERSDAARLAVINADLVRALAAKAEFLASTSHEIRTPLNGILGMTQVMLASDGLSNNMRSQIELVHDAGTAMRALINDILDVAKIENGNFTINPQPTLVAPLVSRVSRLFAAQAHGRGLTFTIDVAAMPDPVMLDRERLTQIVFNLVGNALKFTRDGGVAVRLWRANDTQTGGSDELRLSVTDTGIGIAPEWHAMVFEMFQQVDNSRSRNYAGTGLGLSIVKQLVTAMDGTVTVDSAEGAGSTFTVALPWISATDGVGALGVAASATTGPLSMPMTGEAPPPEDAARGPVQPAIILAGTMMRAALVSAIARLADHEPHVIITGQDATRFFDMADACWLIDAGVAATANTIIPADRQIAGRIMIIDDDTASVNYCGHPNNRVTRVPFVRNEVIAALRCTDRDCDDGSMTSDGNPPMVKAIEAVPANTRRLRT